MILIPPEQGEGMENPGKPGEMHWDVLGVGEQRLAVISAWEEITAAFQRLGDSSSQILSFPVISGQGAGSAQH